MATTFPPPPPLPQKVRVFQRTPPAIFPACLGLLGLGLAWRRGAGAFGIPDGVVELYLGAVSLLFLFSLAAYLVKFARRPGVWAEDGQTLPGRGGLATMSMSTMILAAVLVPYSSGLAHAFLALGFAAHLALAVFVLIDLMRNREGGPPATPALHLVFVGVIVAPFAAIPLGLTGPARWLEVYATCAVIAVYVVTLRPLLGAPFAPPLRPLQAVHLAPAAVIGSTAQMSGQMTLATAALICASLLFLTLVFRVRWLTEAGFSPLWGAFTFPLAAFAGLWQLAASARGWPWAETPAGLILVFATLTILPIAFRIFRMWADGTLAAKTNAAIA